MNYANELRFFSAFFALIHLWSCTANAKPSDFAPASEQEGAITLSDLVELNDIAVPYRYDHLTSALSLSPDGKSIVFQLRQADPESNEYTIEWFLLPLKRDATALRLADAGDPRFLTGANGLNGGVQLITSPAKWSPDGKSIAYIVEKYGAAQLWISQANGESHEQLSNNASNVREFEWSRDGTKIYFTTDVETREETKVSRLNEARNGYILDDRFFPEVSRKPLYATSNKRLQWTYEIRTGRERRASSSEMKEIQSNSHAVRLDDLFDAIPEARISRVYNVGIERIGWAQPVSPEKWRTLRNQPAKLTFISASDIGNPITCEVAICEGVIAAIWVNDLEEIFFERREGVNFGEQVIYAWSLSENTVREVFRTTDVIEECIQRERELICLYANPTQPQKIVSISLEDGEISTLFDPNPNLRTVEFSDVERVEWANEFGHETFGYFVKPLNYIPGKQYPLVIASYRARGFLRGAQGDEIPIHVLAANGIAVFMLDKPNALRQSVKGADRHKKGFQEYRAAISSIDKIIEILDRRGEIDPNRIAITGLSDGVAIAFFALVHSNYEYAAAIACTALWEPITFYLTTNEKRKNIYLPYYGVEVTEAGLTGDEFFSGISPSKNAAKIDAPILYNLPDSEMLSAMQSIVTLKELGKPVDAFIYPDEFHIKWQPAHRRSIYRRNVQWLQFWLQGKEVDDPVDPRQFERWRRLRDDHCGNINAERKRQQNYCD